MLIKVKVYPQAKKEAIILKSTNSYIIKVKEKAEKGKANQKVKKILSSYFKVDLGKIILLKGGKKQNKIFEIKL
ncbi:MAG: DUF167 domain-containing protein [Microgenomates group bacterium]|nr:DUF167 domain-containing protein [Microgenomates group bacterium]